MKNALLKLTCILLVLIATTAEAQTPGQLVFKVTTPVHTTGNYTSNGRYVFAVWIESCTTCGSGTTAGTSTFVRTMNRYWGPVVTDHLPTWAAKSGGSVVGAITGSTLNTWGEKTITWDGKNDTETTLLPDGNYRICVQETWGHQTATVTRYFPFVKGPVTDNQMPIADSNFTSISLDWAPLLLTTAAFSDRNPEALVYPNPTKGIFNVDYKNDVTKISVVNILGAIVYETLIETTATQNSLKIDLSKYASGEYIVLVANDKGSSSYKVLLAK